MLNQSAYAEYCANSRMNVVEQNGNDGLHYGLNPDNAPIPKAEPVLAHNVLMRGVEHMQERAATYDKPTGERSIGATVAAFNAITGHTLNPEEGWLFMILLKAVRSQQGNFKLDNYEDLAAYAGLMAEEASKHRGC